MTTIKTTSKSKFEQIFKYFSNKRMNFFSSNAETIYSITLYNLTREETDILLEKMFRYLRLKKVETKTSEMQTSEPPLSPAA